MNDYLAASNATSLLDMANGAIKERIDYEMGRVMQNISDPNTKASAKREITLKITLAPDEDRKHIEVSCAGSHEPGEDQPGDRPRERPDRSRGTHPADSRPA